MMRQLLVQRIKAIRTKACLSARKLSLMINCSENYITKVESGQTFPSFESLENIIKACDSSFSELFSEDFESYAIDKEIITILKKVEPKHKDAILALCVALYHRDEERVTKENNVC